MAHQKKQQPACFLFTQETLALTREAIACFEQPLQEADHQDTKVVFAEVALQGVKKKLAALQTSPAQVSFDYNEKIILIHALQLCCAVLLSTPVSTWQTRQIQQCQQIAAFFAAENARTVPARLND
jgi:hypothetical protein